MRCAALNDNPNNDDLIFEANRLVTHFDDIGDYEKSHIINTLIERFMDYRDLVDETHLLLDTVNKYEIEENSSQIDLDWEGEEWYDDDDEEEGYQP